MAQGVKGLNTWGGHCLAQESVSHTEAGRRIEPASVVQCWVRPRNVGIVLLRGSGSEQVRVRLWSDGALELGVDCMSAAMALCWTPVSDVWPPGTQTSQATFTRAKSFWSLWLCNMTTTTRRSQFCKIDSNWTQTPPSTISSTISSCSSRAKNDAKWLRRRRPIDKLPKVQKLRSNFKLRQPERSKTNDLEVDRVEKASRMRLGA